MYATSSFFFHLPITLAGTYTDISLQFKNNREASGFGRQLNTSDV